MNGWCISSLLRRGSIRVGVSAVLIGSIAAIPAMAQEGSADQSPAVTLGPWFTDQVDSGGARHSPAPIGTPGEMRVDVEILHANSDAAVHPATAIYPKDAIESATLARARVWLDSLSKLETKGIHLTPYGQLAVTGNQAELAQKQLADRLAQPGLTAADKGFVYYAGTAAFADRAHPEWIPIAQKYLAQLVALGSSQNTWQFEARSSLAQAYYDMGQRQQALAEATKAYPLLVDQPFEYHLEAMSGLHLLVCDMLLGTPSTPNGLAKLHSIDSLIFALAKAPEDRIRLDSMTLWMGQRMMRMVQADSAFAVMLGHPSPAIVGNIWFNRTDTSAYKLDDGKIHLLHFFPPDFPTAQGEQFMMTRVQQHFGDAVQVIGIGGLTGHWGMQFVKTDEEAQRWGKFMQDSLKVAFPITFWVHEKVKTPWGGFLPPENPNVPAYHVPQGMGVIVVDGHGHPRRYFFEGRDQEEDMINFIAMLLKEEQH